MKNTRVIIISICMLLVLLLGFGCDAVLSSKNAANQVSSTSSTVSLYTSSVAAVSSSSQSQISSSEPSSAVLASSSDKIVKPNPSSCDPIGVSASDDCTSSSSISQQKPNYEPVVLSEFAEKLSTYQPDELTKITFLDKVTNYYNTADLSTSIISASELLEFIKSISADISNAAEIQSPQGKLEKAVNMTMLFNYKKSLNININNNYLTINISDKKNIVKYPISEENIKFVDTIRAYANQGQVRKNPDTAKPVIYLYPTEQTNVNVKLNFKGKLTYTYPKYNNGWDVKAYPDGTINNLSDNTTHNYLFWEGNADNDWNINSGFVVKGEDTEKFLIDKLSYMGLTPKEYNDFIVYWVPKMQDNKYNLISFSTKQYEEYAKLEITPKPDSILRVHMLWQGIDKPVAINQETLQTFERKGFTAVEWGGTELK